MTLLAKRNGTTLPRLLSNVLESDDFFGTNLFDRGNFFLPNLVSEIPPANVTERKGDFLIELAVPGLEKKDFKVEMENGLLSISAEKEEKREENSLDLTRKEYFYGKFCRTFRLPENTKEDKIKAEYANGILKVEIPKKEITLTKTTKEIQVS